MTNIITRPRNVWLQRQRSSGIPHEIKRLYARYLQIRDIGTHDEAVQFLASEYRRNEVYYSFVNMISLRRLGVYFGHLYGDKTKEKSDV